MGQLTQTTLEVQRILDSSALIASGVTTEDGKIQAINFDTNPTIELLETGSLSWNNHDMTFNVKSNEATLQVNQEQVFPVINNTLSTLPNGALVRITGHDELTEYDEVELSSNDSELTAFVDGVLTQELLPGAVGLMTQRGKVRELNTTGGTVANLAYLGVGGAFTSVKPVYPAKVIVIGKYSHIDSVNGELIVDVSSSYQVVINDIETQLDLKAIQNVGICQRCPILTNDIVIDYTALTLTVATVNSGQTITPQNPIRFFTNGNGVIVKHEKSSPEVFTFTNTTGTWYFYWDTNGNPIASQTAWTDFNVIAPLFMLDWNSTLTGATRSIEEQIEMHTNSISGDDHANQHFGTGTIHLFGGDLIRNELTTGSPNVDGRNTCVSLTTLTNMDDNLRYTVTNTTDVGYFKQDMGNISAGSLTSSNSGLFPIRINNVSGQRRFLPATRFPFAWDVATNRPQYITANGTRTLVTDDYYFVYYLYSLQDRKAGQSVRLVSAESEFSTIALARAHSIESVQALYPDMRNPECRPLYKLIFYNNHVVPAPFDVAVKYTRLHGISDIRKIKGVTSTSVGGSLPASSVNTISKTRLPDLNIESAMQRINDYFVGNTGATATIYSIPMFDSTTGLNITSTSAVFSGNNLTINGQLSATTFIGDGSNLTNIPKPFTTGNTGNYSIKANNNSAIVASGNYSYAEGFATSGTGVNSHAEGETTIASGYTSHAEGGNTKAYGNFSHSEGNNSIANGINSHAEGNNTQVYGDNSHGEGNNTLAEGINSHAEGNNTRAIGDNSHSEGRLSQANGFVSHAEGLSTQANGQYTHSEGNNTQANGNYSHVEGYYSIASGETSHAEGDNTIAGGINSHAEGSYTQALGRNSHAGGYNSRSESQNSFVHSNGSVIRTGATNSVIIGGSSNEVLANVESSAIIGGVGITASQSNTVYVPKLNINTVDAKTTGKLLYVNESTGLVTKGVLGTSDFTGADIQKIGINVLNPTYQLEVNGRIRSVSEYTSLNKHDIDIYSTLNISTEDLVNGYSAFDAYPTMNNTAHIGHFNGYQSRLNVSGTSTIDSVMGYNTILNVLGSGTITQYNAFRIYAPKKTGSGTIGTAIGLYVDNLTGASANYAIYTAGSTKSYFGGNIGIKTDKPDYDLDVIGTSRVLGLSITTNGTALGSEVGDNLLLRTTSANSNSNYIKDNEWLVRGTSGSTWLTAKLHNGVSVDNSFTTPGTNTLTWWERNPNANTQSWGNSSSTYMSLKSGQLGISTTNILGNLHVLGTTASNNAIFERTAGGSDAGYITTRLLATKTTDMGAGFGPLLSLNVKDDAAIVNTLAYIGALRENSDTTGSIILQPFLNGTPIEGMRVLSSGNVGIGTSTPAQKLHVNGTAQATQFRLSDLNTAPSGSTDTGVKGEIRIDDSYIYVCTATNTWKRTGLSTW